MACGFFVACDMWHMAFMAVVYLAQLPFFIMRLKGVLAFLAHTSLKFNLNHSVN